MDSNVFIYSFERNPTYVTLAEEVFGWVEQPGHSAVTSTVTMTEFLARPYRTLREVQVGDIYTLLLTYPNLEWIAPDLKIADTAARLRAIHKLKTPDALQAATAIRSGATLLVTNDTSFERIPGLETLILDRLL